MGWEIGKHIFGLSSFLLKNEARSLNGKVKDWMSEILRHLPETSI